MIEIRSDAALIRSALVNEAARLRRFAHLRSHAGPDWAPRRAAWRAEAIRLEEVARGAINRL